jgi:hypothetical protein
MKKILATLMLTFVLTMTLSPYLALAADNNPLSSALSDIQKSPSNGLGSQVEQTPKKIAKALLNIVGIIVMAYVAIHGLITVGKLSHADTRTQPEIKKSLAYHVVGLVLLANYFGLINYIFSNVKVFS